MYCINGAYHMKHQIWGLPLGTVFSGYNNPVNKLWCIMQKIASNLHMLYNLGMKESEQLAGYQIIWRLPWCISILYFSFLSFCVTTSETAPCSLITPLAYVQQSFYFSYIEHFSVINLVPSIGSSPQYNRPVTSLKNRAHFLF